jgi:uncharacterized protein (TIGR02147 family)
MTVTPKLPSVFDFIDYRRYLEEYFTARRMMDARFSLRVFASRAGLPLSNSSLFSKIIAGKRNLTLDLQYKIAKALKLSATESEFFGALVRFNQSKSGETKEQLYKELAKYRKSKARILSKEAYAYYAHWRNSIIRAYIGINQNEKNPAAIGKSVFPALPVKEVETSLQLLLQLGLIVKTANGYALSEAHIATERENKDFVGKLRIEEMLKLAHDVFPHVPAEHREYSAMTVFISQQGYKAIQEKIRRFREEVKAIVADDQAEDRIYTMGLQFFPNSGFSGWQGEVEAHQPSLHRKSAAERNEKGDVEADKSGKSATKPGRAMP